MAFYHSASGMHYSAQTDNVVSLALADDFCRLSQFTLKAELKKREIITFIEQQSSLLIDQPEHCHFVYEKLPMFKHEYQVLSIRKKQLRIYLKKFSRPYFIEHELTALASYGKHLNPDQCLILVLRQDNTIICLSCFKGYVIHYRYFKNTNLTIQHAINRYLLIFRSHHCFIEPHCLYAPGNQNTLQQIKHDTNIDCLPLADNVINLVLAGLGLRRNSC